MPRITVNDLKETVTDNTRRIQIVENKLDANYDLLDRVLSKVSELDTIKTKVDDTHDLFFKNGLVKEIKGASSYINEQKQKEQTQRKRINSILDNLFKWIFRIITLASIGMVLRFLDLPTDTLNAVIKLMK